MNSEINQANSMSNDLRQQLSALVDGELDRDQMRFLLKRLQGDADLVACWQSWHVAGDCLRGNATAPMRDDFAARIALALEVEAVPGRNRSGEMLKWAGGLAVAASVALAALLAVNPASVPGDSTRTGSGIAATPAVPAAEVAPSPYREQDLRPPLRLDAQLVADTGASPYAAAVRIDPRIESFLVRHNEATAMQGRGFVPYVTLVTPLRERAPAPEPAR
jgi:sigma-E factor negative regulatory protein RseA